MAVQYLVIRTGIKGETGSTGPTGAPGLDGTTAYESYVAAGGLLSESEFNATLYRQSIIPDLTVEPTGFTNNSNINVEYNDVTRKIKLTGTFEAYYKGTKVTELVDGWESPAHADAHGTYFLHYCNNQFIFDTTPWFFDCLQIAFVQINNHKLAIREVHGLMQWQCHEALHRSVGTFRVSGGEIPSNSFIAGSTIAANRRPDITTTVVQDEDLLSNVNALSDKLYCVRSLVGVNATRTIEDDQADIIKQVNGVAQYNTIVNGAWDFAPVSNNNYAGIFVVAIPVTSDSLSQKHRYMFVQPQVISSSIQTIRDLTPNSVNLGDPSVLVSEFVFIAKVIVRQVGASWSITEVQQIRGTKLSQTASNTSNALTVVEHDETLQGNGTVLSPLGMSDELMNRIIALENAILP